MHAEWVIARDAIFLTEKSLVGLQAIRMTATSVRRTSARRVPTVQTAILIIGGSRTFARCMSACFSRLCVIHFSSFSMMDLLVEGWCMYKLKRCCCQYQLHAAASIKRACGTPRILYAHLLLRLSYLTFCRVPHRNCAGADVANRFIKSETAPRITETVVCVPGRSI